MQFKNLIKQITPPFIVNLVTKNSGYGWFGDYSSWSDAQKHCSGYDSPLILEKCKNALLKVKNGEAVCERDSVVFDKVEYSWPVLVGLLQCAAQNNGKLHVLDFGGSLGSSYYQNRGFCLSLEGFSWSIVEQQHFVDCGKKNFEDGVLKFYTTIEECLGERRPNVLLLSSVVQYLENPYDWLKRFIDMGINYIIIDRTAFIDRNDDLIAVQNVPPSIYKASYPVWAFNENKFLSFFSEKYNLLIDCEGVDSSNYEGMYFKCFIYEKIQQLH